MLRSAFRRDELYRKDIFPSPQSVIGNATHKLKEVAIRGDLKGQTGAALRNEASRLWEEEIDKGYGKMRSMALADPPVPTEWYRYQINRMSAIRDLEGLATTLYSADSNEQFRADPEVLLKAYDGTLQGIVDLVRKSDDGIEIVDYKTGDLLERENPQHMEPQIKPAYTRQLLLYAHLYHQQTGIWPTKVTIGKADGSQSFSFNPDQLEADRLAAEALEMLEQYNEDARSGSLLATPSEEACRYCAFKAACSSFFGAANAEWEFEDRYSVKGKVGLMQPDIGLVLLIEVTGNVDVSQINVLKVPIGFFAYREVGDIVSFSELQGAPSRGLGFRWWSRSWKWN